MDEEEEEKKGGDGGGREEGWRRRRRRRRVEKVDGWDSKGENIKNKWKEECIIYSGILNLKSSTCGI